MAAGKEKTGVLLVKKHGFLDHEEFAETARLAYCYWERRGHPHGSADDDWFRAEYEIQKRRGSLWDSK